MYKAELEKVNDGFDLYIKNEEGFAAFNNYGIEKPQIKTNQFGDLVIAVDIPVTSIEMVGEDV